MELHHLRTFVIVAEEASVTKAAQRLFMTPPTVSSHIKALEDELSVQLFERTSRGMKLSEKGTLLREKALATLMAAQDLVNHATNMQTDLIGEVKVGLNASPSLLRVVNSAEILARDYPGIALNLEPSSTGKIIDGLLKRQTDIGFIFGEPTSSAISTCELQVFKLLIAIPKAHGSHPHTWETIADLPWIYTSHHCPFQNVADDLFAQHALETTCKVVSNDEASRLELVKAGVGASLLLNVESESAISAGDIAVWRHNVAETKLQLAWLTEREREPLIEPALEALKLAWKSVATVPEVNDES